MRSTQEIERAIFALRIAKDFHAGNGQGTQIISDCIDLLKWVDGQPSQFERDMADFEDNQQRKSKLDRPTRNSGSK